MVTHVHEMSANERGVSCVTCVSALGEDLQPKNDCYIPFVVKKVKSDGPEFQEYIPHQWRIRGGGGQRGQWHPPFRKKNLHAYFLTINNPALAVLFSSNRLEDIRGLHSEACDSSNNAHQKINTRQPHPLAAHELLHQQSAKCNWNGTLYYQNMSQMLQNPL